MRSCSRPGRPRGSWSMPGPTGGRRTGVCAGCGMRRSLRWCSPTSTPITSTVWPVSLHGRQVGEIQVTGLRDPEEGAEQVERWAAAEGVPLRVPVYAEHRVVGALAWQLVGRAAPPPRAPTTPPLTLLVESAGIRILLSGDVEPVAQAALLRTPALAPVDVLKVPAPRKPPPGPPTAARPRDAGRPGLGRSRQRLRAPLGRVLHELAPPVRSCGAATRTATWPWSSTRTGR